MAVAQQPTESMRYLGFMEGHKNWVTCIRTACLMGQQQPEYDGLPSAENDVIVSGSRDHSLMIWKYVKQADDRGRVGYCMRSLTGHSQTVSDVALSATGQFALSGSWDHTAKLWSVLDGRLSRTFVGHTSDVNTVNFSPDDRQILTSGRDKTIKLWNTVGECKHTFSEHKHNDWVSCLRFSPDVGANGPVVVSGGWDKLVKVWNLATGDLKYNLFGHTGAVYTVTISPDGSLCASGGKDCVAMLWDVNEGRHLYSLEAGSVINSLCFSPCNYWLCAATDDAVLIWNLETKKELARITENSIPSDVSIARKKSKVSGIPWCTTLAWSSDGQTLFVGSSDSRIYVFECENHH